LKLDGLSRRPNQYDLLNSGSVSPKHLHQFGARVGGAHEGLANEEGLDTVALNGTSSAVVG
jgi:hypothetical protein